VGDATETPSNSPRGTVISTRPAAGSQVSVPTTVSLVISGGAAVTQMPDLMSQDLDRARQTLTQLGVHDVQVVYDPMAVGERGTIVGQSPVPNATILPGATVQLRVAGENP
jgi:serine/threonine-protein kinase